MTYSEHHLGSVIRKYRKERGYTQATLAEKIGITQRLLLQSEAIADLPGGVWTFDRVVHLEIRCADGTI